MFLRRVGRSRQQSELHRSVHRWDGMLHGLMGQLPQDMELTTSYPATETQQKKNRGVWPQPAMKSKTADAHTQGERIGDLGRDMGWGRKHNTFSIRERKMIFTVPSPIRLSLRRVRVEGRSLCSWITFYLSHFWFLSSYRLGGGVGWVGSAGDLINSGIYTQDSNWLPYAHFLLSLEGPPITSCQMEKVVIEWDRHMNHVPVRHM